MPRDPLEEFYGRSEAAIQPGDASKRTYGTEQLTPLPQDVSLLPSDLASDSDNPAWARRFTNAFRFKTSRALSRIATIILPAMPIGTFNPEDYFPDDLLCWGGDTAVQTAAQVSAVAIFNPSQSGLLMVLEEVQVMRLQTAGPIGWLQSQAIPSGGNWGTLVPIALARDTRFGAQTFLPTTKAIINHNTNAPNPALANGVGGGALGSGAGSAPAVWRSPVPLAPGTGLVWFPATPGTAQLVNEGITIVAAFRLKVIDPAGQKTPITN